MRQEAWASPEIRRGFRLWSSPQSCLLSCRGGTPLPRGWQGQGGRQYFYFFFLLLHDLKLFEGLCDDDACVSPGGWCGWGLVSPGTVGGRGAVPGRGGWARLGAAFQAGDFLSCLRFVCWLQSNSVC